MKTLLFRNYRYILFALALGILVFLMLSNRSELAPLLFPIVAVGNVRELRARRAEMLEQARAIVDGAEAEDRDLTPEEQTQFDQHLVEANAIEQRYGRLESLPEVSTLPQRRSAPNYNRLPLGDSEERAMAHFFKTGDLGGVRDLRDQEETSDLSAGQSAIRIRIPSTRELRAVDSTMNITTAADGGSLVPTGFSGEIAMRRNEIRLAERLGVRMVPGKGTTVNFPFENADPVVFAATSEQADNHANTYERDAAVIGNKAFTLAKKTKKLELTEELLDDEDANLMGFISDWIGRSIGTSHNAALLTEVASNGTALKTFAAAAAIAAGEPEDIVFHDTLGYYLDDGSPASWVMRPTTFGNIASITGNARLYAQTPGGSFAKEILGYPVFYSNNAAATAASAKDVYFGNWFYVGMREDPALRLIRDPYSVDGLVILKYSFRLVYGVLIAGAVGYGVHPSA